MASGEPAAPSRRDALAAARRALRDAQLADRDELRAAQAVLRDAARAHEDAVRGARRRLGRARRGDEASEAEAAERALGEALARRRSVEEARPLLHRLAELVEDGEAVLDMVPGVSSGHDGIVVATERQLLFLALRRTVAHPYAEVLDVAAKGRWVAARLVVSAVRGRLVVSGMAPRQAAAVAALVRERLAPQGVPPASGR